MAKIKGKVVPTIGAVNWTDIIATGAFAEGESGHIVVRASQATRVAVGVADPVASTTAGIALPAGEAGSFILGTAAAAQTLWVQTPASADAAAQLADTIQVEVDGGGPDYAAAVFA